MPRTHEQTFQIQLRHGEDVWPLFEHVERVLEQRLPTWGVGRFSKYVHVQDLGGEFTAETVAEARAEISPRHALSGVRVHARESEQPDLWETHRAQGTVPTAADITAWELAHSRRIAIFALNLDAPATTPKTLFVKATGPVEAEVVGMATVVAEEVKAARRGDVPASLPPSSQGPVAAVPVGPAGPLASAEPSEAGVTAPPPAMVWWKRAWRVVTTHPLWTTVVGTIIASVIASRLGLPG